MQRVSEKETILLLFSYNKRPKNSRKCRQDTESIIITRKPQKKRQTTAKNYNKIHLRKTEQYI